MIFALRHSYFFVLKKNSIFELKKKIMSVVVLLRYADDLGNSYIQITSLSRSLVSKIKKLIEHPQSQRFSFEGLIESSDGDAVF